LLIFRLFADITAKVADFRGNIADIPGKIASILAQIQNTPSLHYGYTNNSFVFQY
jgi:hypothetical protein